MKVIFCRESAASIFRNANGIFAYAVAVAGVKQDHLCICSCELGYDGNVVILLNITLDLS